MFTSQKVELHSGSSIPIPLDIWQVILPYFSSNLDLFTLNRTSKFFYAIVHWYILKHASSHPRFTSIIQKKTSLSFAFSKNQPTNAFLIEEKLPAGQKKRGHDSENIYSQDQQPPLKKIRYDSSSTKEMHVSAENALAIIASPFYTLADRYRILSCTLHTSLNQNQLNIVSKPNKNNEVRIKWKHLSNALASAQTLDLAKNTLLINQIFFSEPQRIILFKNIQSNLQNLANQHANTLPPHALIKFESMLNIILMCVKSNFNLHLRHLNLLWKIIYAKIISDSDDLTKSILAFLKSETRLIDHLLDFMLRKLQIDNRYENAYLHKDLSKVLNKMVSIFSDEHKNRLCEVILSIYPSLHYTDKPSLISLFASLHPIPQQPFRQNIIDFIQTKDFPLLWIKAYEQYWQREDIEEFLNLFFLHSLAQFKSPLRGILHVWLNASPCKLDKTQIDFIISQVRQTIDNGLEHARTTSWLILTDFIEHWTDQPVRFEWLKEKLTQNHNPFRNIHSYPIKIISKIWLTLDKKQQLTFFNKNITNLNGYIDALLTSFTFEIFQFFSDHFTAWEDDQIKQIWFLFFKTFEIATVEQTSQLIPFIRLWEKHFSIYPSTAFEYVKNWTGKIIKNVNDNTIRLEQNLLFLFSINPIDVRQRSEILNFVLRFSTADHLACKRNALDKLSSLHAVLTLEEKTSIAAYSISVLSQQLIAGNFQFLALCADFWDKKQIALALTCVFKMPACEKNHSRLWDIIKICYEKLTADERDALIHYPMSLLIKPDDFYFHLDNCQKFSAYVKNWNSQAIENTLATLVRHWSAPNLIQEIRSLTTQWIALWKNHLSAEQRNYVHQQMINFLNHPDSSSMADGIHTSTLLLPYWNEIECELLTKKIIDCITNKNTINLFPSILIDLASWKPYFTPLQVQIISDFLHVLFLKHPIKFLKNIRAFIDYFDQQQITALFNAVFKSSSESGMISDPLSYFDFQKDFIEFLRSAWIKLEYDQRQSILASIKLIFPKVHEDFKILFFDLFSYWLSIEACSIKQLEIHTSFKNHHFWPLLELTYNQFLTLKKELEPSGGKAIESSTNEFSFETGLIYNSVFSFTRPETECSSMTTLPKP